MSHAQTQQRVADPGCAPDLCASCGERPRLGALSRCLPCLQRDVDRQVARATRTPSPAPAPTEVAVAEPMKACRSCGSVKPLGAFARHGTSKDGRRHRCRDCEPPRRPPRREQRIAELRDANAKLTALLVEAYGHIRGGFQSALQRRALLARINQGVRWLSELETPERPPPVKRYKPPVRYRNPADPLEHWSGRGRMPRWLRAKIEAGAALLDFKIPDAPMNGLAPA
jgi:DNA-binding protein H-NS